MKLFSRSNRIRFIIFLGLLAIALMGTWLTLFQMPGQSYGDVVPALPESESQLQSALEKDVATLAETIGARSFKHFENLQISKDYIKHHLSSSGYQTSEQTYTVQERPYTNITAEKLGSEKPEDIIVVGGHYDSAFDTSGANDNATGAAAVLELARLISQDSPKRTIQFVTFTNEEPPFFWTQDMGSLVYAKAMKEQGKQVVAMISLDTIGYYDAQPNSQLYPFPLSIIYPNQGKFISFLGNLQSGYLVREAIASFREHAKIPSEGVSLPSWITGVGWSDQWSFWQQGYPGIMVTDTAPYRYPYYHTQQDTIDKVDYLRLTHVVSGLHHVVSDLANG